ncbi:hypothetical protein SBV1_900003 [Verrucomicrobia bacterium]|nr:hypothetical protein SBV1_900003 [Verrucomicrobiota bacterium]
MILPLTMSVPPHFKHFVMLCPPA